MRINGTRIMSMIRQSFSEASLDLAPKTRRHCSADSEIAIDRASDGFYTTGPDLFLRGATHVRTG